MAATYQVAPPEQFDFSRPEEWLKWARRFERFRKASGLDGKDESIQVNTLVYTMGDKADDILRAFRLSEDDGKKYSVVKENFDSHFIQRRNVIFERAKFNMRKQEEGEMADAFITALYALAEHCGYGELHDEMVRDRIVVGIKDSALSEKLQLNSKLTLEVAVTKVRQAEAVKQQQSLLRGEHYADSQKKPELPIGAVQGGSGKRFRSRQKSESASCGRCGKTPSHERRQCPANVAVCHKCGKRGHFQSVCRSSARVGGLNQDNQPKDEAFLGTVKQGNPARSDLWMVNLLLNGKSTQLEIDTGAEVSVISPKCHKEIGCPQLRPPQRILRGPSNRELQVEGQFRGTLLKGKLRVEQDIFVVQHLSRNLLGRPAIEALNLLQRVQQVKEEKKSPIEQFPDLFQGLGKLEGEYTIKLEDGAKPYALSAPRRVPIPLRQQVKDELDRMEQLGVISRVREPTDWCSGMVVVPKGNNKVRICVDLTRLNQSVVRERHILPDVEQTLAQLSGAKVFSKLDANSGFWQIPLAKESAKLTTFITPFGRYCFHRLPFGITSAPEHFQQRMTDLLGDVEGVVGMVDDILVHGRTPEEHDKRLQEVLQRLREANLTLNEGKCVFSSSSVKFLGQIIDHSGIRPDPDKISAVMNVPQPTGVEEVRRFLGMTNHLSKFAPHLAEKSKPLRDLLNKQNEWVWDQPQRQSFEEIKQALVSSPVLSLFDPHGETVVAADASCHGLGAVLLQKQQNGEWKPVSYISRSLTTTEQNYAQIEKEALAFTWACERLSNYLLGLRFHIHTDHKPLVPLFSTKNLDELPVRVQRFRLRMMRFDFTISHVPGKSLQIADTLSRAPCAGPSEADLLFQEETAAYVNTVLDCLPATEKQLERICQHQQEDEVCLQIAVYCQSGWPSKHALAGAMKPYYPLAAELSVENGVLMRGSRVVIPTALRLEMLDRIHTGHQGIAKCRQRARQSVWWPGLSKQLDELVKNCTTCCKAQTQRAEPLIPSLLPQLPWQKLGTDLFYWKNNAYLLYVDYYSRFIEIAKLRNETAEEVIAHSKSIFARHGIPEAVISDNGPQYASEAFATFANQYHFEHITSSPYYPQGNGEAERAVQTIKSLLRKEEEPYLALLAYRDTPLQCGYSPSELLMSRKLRTNVPVTRSQLVPKVPDQIAVRQKDEELKSRQQRNYDCRRGTRDLESLSSGQLVWVTDREEEGNVTQEVATRSYEVQTPQGSYRRNRRSLISIPEPSTATHQEEDSLDVEAANDSPRTPAKGTVEPPPPIRRSSRVSHAPNRLDPSW